MPLGAGLFGGGLAPAGYGLPDSVPPSPFSPLPDPSTGVSQTGRYIDQRTGDYVMLADGRLQGMGTAAQDVLIAIRNIDLSSLTEKGPNFQGVLSNLVAGALAPLVLQKLIRIKQVVVFEPTQDSGFASVDWFDLTTGQSATTAIGI